MAQKRGKKYLENLEQVDRENLYEIEEATKLVVKTATANFDESIELAVRLGVDPRHADQQVRGTVVLPNGTGRETTVLVITGEDKFQEAKDAGADYVGSQEMVDKIINENWMDYDVIIASPDMMGNLGKAGRVLGPRGLMPNPKSGTVTQDIGSAVSEVKAGKVEYRVDSAAIINVAIAKASFEPKKIEENLQAIMGEIIKARPAAAKGRYLRSVTIAATMGPGIKINPQEFVK